MNPIALFGLLLASVLTPTRTWTTPDAPLTVNVKAEGDERLVLTPFTTSNELGSKDVTGESTPDLKEAFPQLNTPGTYLLYLVPKSKALTEFSGTPLVIQVKQDSREGVPPGPMVIKVEPLKYAVMTTNHGPITLAFYYDHAPNTVNSFLTLAQGNYFDGQQFHRIIKGFVIQGGDPRSADLKAAGTGGPGYSLEAEFNSRKHVKGALSMARGNDPNSAGSQFFICLDYNQTRQLDDKYTVFGQATPDSMKAIDELGSVPTGPNDRPTDPQKMEKVEVKDVTAAENPYAALLAPAAK